MTVVFSLGLNENCQLLGSICIAFVNSFSKAKIKTKLLLALEKASLPCLHVVIGRNDDRTQRSKNSWQEHQLSLP